MNELFGLIISGALWGIFVAVFIAIGWTFISKRRNLKRFKEWEKSQNHTLKSEGDDQPKKEEVPQKAKSSEEEPPFLNIPEIDNEK